MIIGGTIIEAIDWSQDLLKTTRPEAERALFSLIKDKLVVETQRGYEYPDDEDREKVIHNIANAKKKALTHFKVGLRHAGRQWSKRGDMHRHNLVHGQAANQHRAVGQSDEADDMIDADNN